MAKDGLFITLEGGEGSGKSTQIRRLKTAIESKGFQVVTTREPGGSPESEKIRRLLVERDGGDWNPISECLLLFAARSMHVEKLIRPALAQGKVVLCDRFTDSTRAYQGYGHNMDMETIETLNRLTLGDFRPKLTFILDLPVKEGLQRALDRMEEARKAAAVAAAKTTTKTKAPSNAAPEKGINRMLAATLAKTGAKAGTLKDAVTGKAGAGDKSIPDIQGPPAVEDRYEQMDIEFHERMRKGYLEIAERESDRCTVVNASRPAERVTSEILARIFEV